MLKPILISVLLLLTSCASTGIHSTGANKPMRVTVLSYGTRAKFELANASHTDPVGLYSTKRSTSSMKIANDDLMTDLIDFIGSHGFAEFEQLGKAPSFGMSPFGMAFEIETEAGVSHWGTSKQSDLSEGEKMRECFSFFFNQAYNRVEAFQTIENSDGRHTFDG